MSAERVGVTQACAKIVRIGDAVEDEQQGRLRKSIEHVVERDVRERGIDQRDDALVLDRSCQRLEHLVVGDLHGTADGVRARNEVARPRVVAPGRKIDRPQRIRPLPQSRGHCMEAVDRTGGRQGRLWLDTGSAISAC